MNESKSCRTRRRPRRLSHWLSLTAMALAALALLAGCEADEGSECVEDSDCAASERCVLGTCEPRPTIGCTEDADCGEGEFCLNGTCSGSADVIGGDMGDMPGGACTDGVAPMPGALVFNEIHGAPLSGTDDVNCDDSSSSDDEFIEIVNTTNDKLNLSGVQLLENGELRHSFRNCLEPGRGAIVYNQGLTGACGPEVIGESIMITPDDDFALTNSGGETLTLSVAGTTLDEVTTVSMSGNVSMTRVPDFTGTEFVLHDEIPGVEDRFSVGKCVGGDALALGCMPPMVTECGDGTCDPGEDEITCAVDCAAASCEGAIAPIVGELKVNEVHAAPESSLDDVNCDGTTDSKDEYIEIVNDTDSLLDLTGVELIENGEARHTFNGCLAAGRGMVIYNQRLEPMCGTDVLGETIAIRPDDSFALNNGGGESVGLSLGGTVLDEVTLPSLNNRASWTRSPDFSGDFVEHDQIPNVEARFSLGRCVGGGPLERGCMPPDGPVCGDGVCTPDEEASLACPADCQVGMCGDGTCDPGEDALMCPADCTGDCGNGTCDIGEDELTCPADCLVDLCGNGTCDVGEDETTCPADCMPVDPCPGSVDPAAGVLLINEIHAAPNSTDDVNCDGNASGSQDEFVEIVNNSADELDLTGVELTVESSSGADSVKHTFAMCLGPWEAVIIYGGGTPTCPDTSGGGVTVLTSSLSMTNSSSRAVKLFDASGTELDNVAYPANLGGVSYVRSSDYTGTFTTHDMADSVDMSSYSAGTCLDDQAFPACAPMAP